MTGSVFFLAPASVRIRPENGIRRGGLPVFPDGTTSRQMTASGHFYRCMFKKPSRLPEAKCRRRSPYGQFVRKRGLRQIRNLDHT